MSIYDVDGNVISSSGEVSKDEVKRALLQGIADGSINLGSQIGAALSYDGLTSGWVTNATAAYNAMKARYKEFANGAIPFFISTDQHGNGVEQHRWANNIDADGINFANINLGDTVVDYFNHDTLSGVLGRTRQVKNYISITGNHDALWRGDDVPSVYDLTRYFHSTYKREVIPKQNSSYSVLDDEHSAKFLVVDSYFNVGVSKNSLGNSQLTGDLADWLIAEMSQDDYDIVYLQHWMLYAPASTYQYRDGSKDTNNIGGSEVLKDLVTARKNKASGSVTDKDGGTHSYDFSGCKHELLCALHGHEHAEVYAKINNLLCYVSDRYGSTKLCVFGIVDRQNGKLRIWKFDTTAVYDELVLDL